MNYSTLTTHIVGGGKILVVTDEANIELENLLVISDSQKYIVCDMGGDQLLVYPNLSCLIQSKNAIVGLKNDIDNLQYMKTYNLLVDVPTQGFISLNGEDEKLPCLLMKSQSVYEKLDIHFLTASPFYLEFNFGKSIFKDGVDLNNIEVWSELFYNLFIDYSKLGKGDRILVLIPPSQQSDVLNYEIRWMGIFGTEPFNMKKYDPSNIRPINESITEVLEILSDTFTIPTTIDAGKIRENIHKKKYVYIPPKSPIETFTRDLITLNPILGPITMTLLECNNKPIILFGDQHLRSPNMHGIAFREYLEFFFKYSPTDVDFFMETIRFYDIPFQDFDMIKENDKCGELCAVLRHFNDCLGLYKVGCKEKYPNVRFHNIEFRRSFNPIYNLVSQNRILMESVGKNPDSIRDVQNRLKIHCPKFIQALFDGNEENINSEFIAIYNLNNKIYGTLTINQDNPFLKLSKQYKNLPFKDDIAKFMVNEMNVLKNIFDINVMTLGGFLVDFATIAMDGYAIGRMLKGIYFYPKSVSIVYSGDNHTIRYRKILTQIIKAKEIMRYQGVNNIVELNLFDRAKLKNTLDNYFE